VTRVALRATQTQRRSAPQVFASLGGALFARVVSLVPTANCKLIKDQLQFVLLEQDLQQETDDGQRKSLRDFLLPSLFPGGQDWRHALCAMPPSCYARKQTMLPLSGNMSSVSCLFLPPPLNIGRMTLSAANIDGGGKKKTLRT